jgi:hypothetical protein
MRGRKRERRCRRGGRRRKREGSRRSRNVEAERKQADIDYLPEARLS